MNERIKDLWAEAAIDTNEQSNSWETQVNFLDKFAELIVRESATFINVEMSLGGVDGRSLLEHFGLVE